MKPKDKIIYAVIILYIVGVMVAIFRNSDVFLLKLTEAMGFFVFVLVTITGIFDFMLDNGLRFLVPDRYIASKEARLNKEIQNAMQNYFETDLRFMKSYTNERIRFFLAELGLTSRNFDHINFEIIKARLEPINNLEHAIKRLNEIVYCKDIVIAHDNYPIENVVFKRFKYYINFRNIMYDDKYRNHLANIFAWFIIDKLGEEKIKMINTIVMPYESNILLGYEISKRLEKPLVSMLKRSEILISQPWEGSFQHQINYEVIILHDVLVSSTKIEDCINALPQNVHVHSIFALVYRNDAIGYNGKKALEEQNLVVNTLVDLNDDEISQSLATHHC